MKWPSDMRSQTLTRGGLALGLASLVVSCAASPTNYGYPCPALIGVGPPMIFPANGATGVPTNVGLIYFGPPDNQPSLGIVVKLTTPTNVTLTGGQLVAAPSPLPSGVPTGQSSVAETGIPILASGTTYTVQLAGTASPCPAAFTSSGSFTTQ